jgi:mono/diheme cytochrome c family protein
MAAFQTIPLSDRIALAHFVRSLNPMPEDDKQADLDWLGVGKGGAAAGGGAAVAAAAAPGPTIPIEKALALLAEATPAVGAVTTPAEGGGEGARLFAARCASCHGSAGQGGVRVQMLGSAPYAYVVTRSLGDSRGDWATNPASFERLVAEGLPGAAMPGAGDLTRPALRDLYLYLQTLRGRQLAAGRGGNS